MLKIHACVSLIKCLWVWNFETVLCKKVHIFRSVTVSKERHSCKKPLTTHSTCLFSVCLTHFHWNCCLFCESWYKKFQHIPTLWLCSTYSHCTGFAEFLSRIFFRFTHTRHLSCFSCFSFFHLSRLSCSYDPTDIHCPLMLAWYGNWYAPVVSRGVGSEAILVCRQAAL